MDRISRAKAIKNQKELKVITNIGPYLLRKRIAKGGMAELFLADYIREDGFCRVVAVKKILPHLTENKDFINKRVLITKYGTLVIEAFITSMNYLPKDTFAIPFKVKV